jgi:hypothetical protein
VLLRAEVVTSVRPTAVQSNTMRYQRCVDGAEPALTAPSLR